MQRVRHAGVTLKSVHVAKWLPWSIFNVKNDSPGHFSMLKADTGQILTLNFEPKVVKKWLPHEILTCRGVIFQRFFHIENKFVYPRKRSCGGILVSPWLSVYPSVFPSVCPSVKNWFRYNNSSSIWYTMLILHIHVDRDLRRTSVDFGSKGQGQIWTLYFLPFVSIVFAPPLHFNLAYNNDTSQMDWPWPEKDLYWFWGQRIKGQGKIRNLNFLPVFTYRFCSLTPFHFGIQWL